MHNAIALYPDLDAGANVEAWLVTIARRKAIDQLRLRARAPLPIDDHVERPSTTGDPASANIDLWNTVRGLPLKQRESLAYHYLAGLSYAQVAGILGNSEQAARRAAADGMKKLRMTYTSEGSQ